VQLSALQVTFGASKRWQLCWITYATKIVILTETKLLGSLLHLSLQEALCLASLKAQESKLCAPLR